MGLKLKYWQNCVPSGGFGGEPILCLFQLLETVCIRWLVAASLVLRISTGTSLEGHYFAYYIRCLN